jgi:mannitol-1-phosphate 5-dehydrogenase
LTATAVGGVNLAAVGALLGAALAERREMLPVLVCENWPEADTVLAKTLRRCSAADGTFACIPCSVERMVQRVGMGLDLIGENGESAWVPAAVALPGLRVCADFAPYYARKLYTNNAGHALLAYEGFLAGRETLCAALAVPAIRKRLEALLAGSATMLAREYGLAERELAEHVDCLLRYRFASVVLADRVERVARQPLRKLGPQERLVGLLRKLEKHRLPLRPVCRTIAAALRYDDPRDDESRRLQALIRREGPGGVLAEICQLKPEEEGHRLCLAEWAALNNPKEKP